MRTSLSLQPSRDSLRARANDDVRRGSRRTRRGFTLIEVLTATALTLILMSLLAGVFAHVTDSVNNSRATIELNAQLTGVAYRLQKDLEGYTVRPDPLRKDFEDGYLEIMEGRLGRLGPLTGPLAPAFWPARIGSTGSIPYESATLNRQPGAGQIDNNPANANGFSPDTTLGDRDDIIAFTTRSRHEPFTGKFGDGSFSSEVAEVVWFVRGTTLYRRVLLVGNPTIPARLITAPPVPPTSPSVTVAWWELAQADRPYVRSGVSGNMAQATLAATPGEDLRWNTGNHNFYGFADLSVRVEGSAEDLDAATATGAGSNVTRIVPNTLASLAQRENRYAHPYGRGMFPYDARVWNLASGTTPYTTPTGLGLPVMAESTHTAFPFPCLASGAPFTPGTVGGALPTGPTGAVTASTPLFDQLTAQGRYPMQGGAGIDIESGRMLAFDVPAGPPGDTQNFRRTNEDVILTNVIGFDIKVWDPGAPVFIKAGATPTFVSPGDMHYPLLGDYSSGTTFPNTNIAQCLESAAQAQYQLAGYGAYVNLGYAPAYIPPRGAPVPHFNELGNPKSGLSGATTGICVFDAWTNAYEANGIDDDGVMGVDQGTNGYDDNGTGGIDDQNEREAPPPYPFPLRGVQITLRVIEPGTQQIREVTVTQDFILE